MNVISLVGFTSAPSCFLTNKPEMSQNGNPSPTHNFTSRTNEAVNMMKSERKNETVDQAQLTLCEH